MHFVGLCYKTDVIISNINFGDLYSMSNLVLCHVVEWFSASKLGLNLYKTDVMRIITCSASHIGCNGNCKYKISWFTN